jgi:hypothetical protein
VASAGRGSHGVPRAALLLFAGPENKPHTLEDKLVALGFRVDAVDILREGRGGEAPGVDLLDDTVFHFYLVRIRKGFYFLVAAAPPCGTFSSARENQPGPPVLRSFEHVEGLPGLGAGHREELRKANLLAERAFVAAESQYANGWPWFIENPEPRAGKPSIFRLPRCEKLAKLQGVRLAVGDQCPWGAGSQHPTGLLVFGLDFGKFHELRCHHKQQWFVWADALGKDRGGWRSHMPVAFRKVEGKWATASTAAYPANLNIFFADRTLEAYKSFCSRGSS